MDKEYEDLDAKSSNTRDNENSYVAQLGGPLFDVSDSEEEEEHFPEQNFDPIFDVFDQDVAEISPIYDMFDQDEMK